MEEEGKQMKLALCFLTYNTIERDDVWEKWLKGYEDKVNIYVHSKFRFNSSKFPKNYKQVDTIPTKWGSYGLVAATFLLFEAAVADGNTFFILLSDKCIPLKKFKYIYNFFGGLSKDQSFIHESARHEVFGRYTPLRKFFPDEVITKHSQWIILSRKHAQILLRDEREIERIMSPITIPDECWALTWLRSLGLGAEVNTILATTYVNWVPFAGRIGHNCPELYEGCPSAEVIEKMLLGPSLFGRKFVKATAATAATAAEFDALTYLLQS